jgi:hypothetical protein
MRSTSLPVAATLLLALWATPAHADECANVLVVFDRSDSMDRVVPGDERSRWEIAVPAVDSIVQRYSENVRFGLMLFPGGTLDTCEVACTPGFVAVDVGSGTAGAIADALTGAVRCTGTPVGRTMEQIGAIQALREPGKRNYVLLVTDGSETCDGNASAVAAGLVRQDPEVRTFVIGFGAQVDSTELDQIASQGHTQAAFVATDATTLEAAFDQILGTVRDDPEFGCVGGEIPDGSIPGFDSGVPDAGAPADGGPAAGSGDEGGCGCRIASRAAPSAAGLWALVLGLILALDRRIHP